MTLAKSGPRPHPLLCRIVGGCLLAAALGGGPLAAADPVGQIFPKPLPATAATYPYLGYLPAAYATAPQQRFPLVICLGGTGELGDGSSDGTLTESAGNQLARMLHGGPLPLIRGGSSYFSDQGAIVVQPQCPARYDHAKLDATITALLAAYRVDSNRIYLTGYSLGGNGAWLYGLNHAARLAALVPIAGACPPANTFPFANLKNTVVWAIHDADDTTVPTAWTTGTPSSEAPVLSGWMNGIAMSLNGAQPVYCLDSHPDHPRANVSPGGYTSLSGVTATRSAVYGMTTGWVWTSGTAAHAGAQLQLTLYVSGGHGGWDQTYGTGGSPNRPFWDWLLAQHLGTAPVPPPVTPPPVGTDGQILAKTKDATAAPFAYMVRTPSTYSANPAQRFPLVLCLGDSGELGDGSSNGTLVEGATNQLARVLHAGPLALARSGSTYFDDQPAILVQPQAGASWNDAALNTLLDGLVAAYRVDTARIFMTGYGLGGGATWVFAMYHPTRLAALVPICGSNYPGSVARCAPLGAQTVWAFHASSDNVVPTTWTTGVQTGFAPFLVGWVSGTAVSLGGVTPNLCLDSHPDHPKAILSNGTVGSLLGVTTTRTGSYDAGSGWSWSIGGNPHPAARLQVTIYAASGHVGWTETYGSDAASLNRPFWDWLLAQQKAPIGTAWRWRCALETGRG